jgi:hypothetical protein
VSINARNTVINEVDGVMVAHSVSVDAVAKSIKYKRLNYSKIFEFYLCMSFNLLGMWVGVYVGEYGQRIDIMPSSIHTPTFSRCNDSFLLFILKLDLVVLR